MTNPTERPEERDSLAQIEKRHRPRTIQLRPDGPEQEVCDQETRATSAGGTFVPWPCDARTLINEVKELREENERLIDATDMSNPHRCRTQILALEAEVKTLRDEMEGVGPPPSATQLREALGCIKQMEEALREAERRARDVLPTAKSTGSTAMLSFVQYVRDIRKTIARAALSPSDTEGVMTQTANEPST